MVERIQGGGILSKSGNYKIDATSGLVGGAEQRPSPNCDERPAGIAPSLVVLHGISLPPGEFGGPHIEQLFANQLDWDSHPYFGEIRGLKVSSHLLIRRDGALLQFVPLHLRAWHAGLSRFRERAQCNDFSLGIELEGVDDAPYEDCQYATLIDVLRSLFGHYRGINPRHVVGHCDIAPGRKTDPGTAFDWLRLYDGLGATSGN